MSATDALELIKTNAGSILQFSAYLDNDGFRLTLITIAMDEYESGFRDASQFIDELINDVYVEVSLASADEALDRIIDRALSFAALIALTGDFVDGANNSELILPSDLIPDDEVITAILELFNERQKLGWIDTYTPNIGVAPGKYPQPE